MTILNKQRVVWSVDSDVEQYLLVGNYRQQLAWCTYAKCTLVAKLPGDISEYSGTQRIIIDLDDHFDQDGHLTHVEKSETDVTEMVPTDKTKPYISLTENQQECIAAMYKA